MARPAIHPGEILADELEGLGLRPTELARQIKVPANRITQIIQGKRAITGDTALRLGHWFKTTPEFWLNLQIAYDEELEKSRARRCNTALYCGGQSTWTGATCCRSGTRRWWSGRIATRRRWTIAARRRRTRFDAGRT